MTNFDILVKLSGLQGRLDARRSTLKIAIRIAHKYGHFEKMALAVEYLHFHRRLERDLAAAIKAIEEMQP